MKVGKFGEGADLQYQDTLEGSLITTADRVIDLIFLKYLKAKITYEHDRRVETYPFAREAIREAVYNAIAHNCYMFGTPIQIRIENEAIIISNRCILPEGWNVETLMKPHDSIPYNPDIANVFYRAGYIETWGRGIQKICDACRELGTEMPRYELIGNGIRVHFAALRSALIEEKGIPNRQSVKENGALYGALEDDLTLKIIQVVEEAPAISQTELAKRLGTARRTVQRKMDAMKTAGLLERKGGKRYGYWEIKEMRR